MTEIPDSPDALFARWKFQDSFRDAAIEFITAGGHLGAIALAKQVLVAQIRNGNRTLRQDEMLELIEAVRLEVRTEAERGINNAGEPETT